MVMLFLCILPARVFTYFRDYLIVFCVSKIYARLHPHRVVVLKMSNLPSLMPLENIYPFQYYSLLRFLVFCCGQCEVEKLKLFRLSQGPPPPS